METTSVAVAAGPAVAARRATAGHCGGRAAASPVRSARWCGVALAVVAGVLALPASPAAARGGAGTGRTVWLCNPARADDPCAGNLATTVVRASGAASVRHASPDPSSPFDCFYVYPTVSTEHTTNADLRVQAAERDVATAQASRFSPVCRVWAPMYRQVTVSTLAAAPTLRVPPAATATAYASLRSAFRDFLAHDDRGRPIVFIGHSQGAAMLILLLRRMVDGDPTLRRRTVLAIILGGNVEVRDGQRTGGSFRHIPTCARPGEAGCVIAYSSFPGRPPPGALFGRPGQGVSLQSGQTATRGLQVACVNPAALAGGSGDLVPYFPSLGQYPTPWVSYPGLYTSRCRHAGGASWLEVRGDAGPADHRPTVTQQAGPDWGYHADDVNLALGNLVTDVALAERGWRAGTHPATR